MILEIFIYSNKTLVLPVLVLLHIADKAKREILFTNCIHTLVNAIHTVTLTN